MRPRGDCDGGSESLSCGNRNRSFETFECYLSADYMSCESYSNQEIVQNSVDTLVLELDFSNLELVGENKIMNNGKLEVTLDEYKTVANVDCETGEFLSVGYETEEETPLPATAAQFELRCVSENPIYEIQDPKLLKDFLWLAAPEGGPSVEYLSERTATNVQAALEAFTSQGVAG